MTTTYTGIDSYLALPCRQYARLHIAASRAANRAYRADLERMKEDLLAETGRIGSVLDDRGGNMGLGLLSERLEFLTPDGRVLSVPVFKAAILARRFYEKFGLAVQQPSAGRYQVVMTRWPDS